MLRRFLSSQSSPKTKKDRVLKILESRFGYNLIYADVKNNSWKENLPCDSEKHLEVIVVSNEFEGVKKEKRIEMMKKLLGKELKNSEVVYKLLTPSLWYDSNQRGLKLDRVYKEAPIMKSPKQFESVYKSFYQQTQTQTQAERSQPAESNKT